jgi:hypothetical protein
MSNSKLGGNVGYPVVLVLETNGKIEDEDENDKSPNPLRSFRDSKRRATGGVSP